MGWTQTAEWRVPFDGFTWPVHFTNRCLLLRSPRLRSSPRVHRVWDDEFPHVRDRRIQSVHDVVEIQMKTRSKSVFTFVTSVIRCFPVFLLVGTIFIRRRRIVIDPVWSIFEPFKPVSSTRKHARRLGCVTSRSSGTCDRYCVRKRPRNPRRSWCLIGVRWKTIID